MLARSDPTARCGEVPVRLPNVWVYWVSVGGAGDPLTNSAAGDDGADDEAFASSWVGKGEFRLNVRAERSDAPERDHWHLQGRFRFGDGRLALALARQNQGRLSWAFSVLFF